MYLFTHNCSLDANLHIHAVPQHKHDAIVLAAIALFVATMRANNALNQLCQTIPPQEILFDLYMQPVYFACKARIC